MRGEGWRDAGSPPQRTTTQSIEVQSDTRKATASDASRLATTLAEAFVDDPVFLWLMPDDASRQRRLRRFFEIELSQLVLPRGRACTSPDLTGAALSLPPGAWRAPTRVAVQHGRCFGIHLPKAAGLAALMERRHLREPHYYFPYIGVAPEAQGRGLGSTLMRPTLDRCDKEGLPAFLEATNERNTALYERLGFERRGDLSFAGGPPLHLMVRPPRSRRESA
jgi:ribosomal protein S18 acetylase RimI-like enzyme